MSKHFKKYAKITNLLLIVVFLLTAGFGCKGTDHKTKQYLQPITLNYWRVWDDEDAFSDIIAAYKTIHPNITINYRKFRMEEYEQALLDALAEDRGPDIFSIPEDWLKEYQNKLTPMPASITMAYQKVVGGLKKEVVAELQTKTTPSARQLKTDFVQTVYNNVSLGGEVYGLPLSLPTLVMFYNKDMLNRNNISQVPTDWTSFQKAVTKITRFDAQGNILQAGAALGTSKNVANSSDILSVLMMQNGAQMTQGNSVTFFKNQSQDYNPGLEAIRFYTDFALPTKSVYTWNESMADSFLSFYSGKVAFVFGYNYRLPTIKAKAPRLNLGIAPIPQVNPEAPVNFARYWIESVSKKSKHQNEAWDFILFATSAKQVSKYLEKTQNPTALTSLINDQVENENLYAASVQTLTAKNWYNGREARAAENALDTMITQILDATDQNQWPQIIKTAVSKINQTY